MLSNGENRRKRNECWRARRTPHRQALGLGYAATGVVLAGPVFVQMFVELGLELGVDNVAVGSDTGYPPR